MNYENKGERSSLLYVENFLKYARNYVLNSGVRMGLLYLVAKFVR